MAKAVGDHGEDRPTWELKHLPTWARAITMLVGRGNLSPETMLRSNRLHSPTSLAEDSRQWEAEDRPSWPLRANVYRFDAKPDPEPQTNPDDDWFDPDAGYALEAP